MSFNDVFKHVMRKHPVAVIFIIGRIKNKSLQTLFTHSKAFYFSPRLWDTANVATISYHHDNQSRLIKSGNHVLIFEYINSIVIP